MVANYDILSDPYVGSTTGIMCNSVKARMQPELTRIEAAFASVRAYELEKGPAIGRYDLDRLRGIHEVCSVTYIPRLGNYGQSLSRRAKRALPCPAAS